MNGSKRVLILIVAYNAEKTIRSVLKRIPVDRLPSGTEVLVVDDSSSDKTFEVARRDLNAVPGLKMTVLYNPENQGYGGNQKIGYQYAIEHGFDVVALLHGDGQYAPEKLPEIIQPLLSGDADACFGSRIMERGTALRNGMPVYKFLGNRILTVFENAALGMNLSEFHSGYRAYSVAALKQLPFRYNTNDFHFDTEIIIQFHTAGFRIKEIPIPTYYGDEICYVNGLSYAWNVVRSTLASRVCRAGLFYSRKFDVPASGAAGGQKMGYVSSHTLAIDAVRAGSTVLDLCCGLGDVARELEKKGCRVTGIDRKPAGPAASKSSHGFDRFIPCDLDSSDLPEDLGSYDFILALDSVEHLGFPEGLLEKLRSRCYSDRTVLVVTVPNIGFFVTRFGLLLGQFNYGKAGILDLGHRRLFTFNSLRRLLEQEGYKVIRMRGIPAPYPKAIGDTRFSRFLVSLNRTLIRIWPRMFSYQVYAEARFLPPIDRLLARTIEASRTQDADSRANRS